jgi:hypothetical protein
LENAPTHLHNCRDRHQERDDPHNGTDLRRKEEENGGGRRGREEYFSVLLSIFILFSKG